MSTRLHDVTSQKTLSSNYGKINCIGQIELKIKKTFCESLAARFEVKGYQWHNNKSKGTSFVS